MPTILPADIDETQRQIYLRKFFLHILFLPHRKIISVDGYKNGNHKYFTVQMDIEETTRRLRQGDFGQNVDPSERFYKI